MGPEAFVGVTDWRSIVLALVFVLWWLVWLARGRMGSIWLWLPAAVTAALFPYVLAWMQVPLQQAMGRILSQQFDAAMLQSLLLVVSIPSLLIASVVQELVKAVVGIGFLKLIGEDRDSRAGLAQGAAAGAGFGGFEAFWTFNTIFGAGFTLGTIQLAGWMVLLGFVERFFAVSFHIGTAAISVYGYATGRFWRFFLLSVVLHTVYNFSVVLMSAKLLDATSVEIYGAVVSLLTIGLAIRLRQDRRSMRYLAKGWSA